MQIHYNIKSNNFTEVENKRNISFIILHYTELDFKTSVEYLCSEEKAVSSHYLIDKKGEIFNLVEDKNIAWHAGKSYWKGIEAINNYSIGIEIENLGNEEFTDYQMNSAIWLCLELKRKYQIPRENILGHSDIAPSRKIDPGIFFDWNILDKEGLGIPIPKIEEDEVITYSNIYNIQEVQASLQKVGYQIDITGKMDLQTEKVIRAFQSHFYPRKIKENIGVENYNDPSSMYSWDENSNKLLSNIVRS